jgi:hypothetical protein
VIEHVVRQTVRLKNKTKQKMGELYDGIEDGLGTHVSNDQVTVSEFCFIDVGILRQIHVLVG